MTTRTRACLVILAHFLKKMLCFGLYKSVTSQIERPDEDYLRFFLLEVCARMLVNDGKNQSQPTDHEREETLVPVPESRKIQTCCTLYQQGSSCTVWDLVGLKQFVDPKFQTLEYGK